MSAYLVAARTALEEALAEIDRLPPRVERAPFAAMIGKAIAAISEAMAGPPGDPDLLERLSAGRVALAGVDTALRIAVREKAGPVHARIDAARRALDRHREAALAAPPAAPAAPPPPAPLRASVGGPALHRLDRRPLVPPPRPGDDDPPRPQLDPHPGAVLLVDQLRSLAHDCFAEMAELGNLRRAGGDVAWMPELGRFEDRLLADLDAAVALGRPVLYDGAKLALLDPLAEAIAWADDALFADPGRAFARAFFLGCVAGEDTARAAVLALRRSSPETHEAQVSALGLASHPGIAQAVEPLLFDAEPALAAAALDILTLRGEGSAAIGATLLAHPEPRVRTSAARLLGTVRDAAPAVTVLSAALSAERDLAVLAEGCASLCRLGSREGLRLARARVEDRSLDPAASAAFGRVLAAAGGPLDLAALLRAFEAHPAPETALALGVHGHPGAVDALLDAFAETQGSDLRAAIAASLTRLTGVPVEDRTDDVIAFWSTRRDALGAREDRPRRLRRGQPWTLSASLDELAAPGHPEGRALLALEIAAATSGAVRLDTSGWVARQLGAIAAARAEIAEHPGEWPEARLT